MPTLSKVSLERLSTCHPDLQRIAHEAIKETDFLVACGHRDQQDQHSAFVTGKSRVDWPNSRHNASPSQAMDLVPYPVDWNDLGRFHDLAAVILRVAAELGIALEWGGDWRFRDMPHYQLKRLAVS